MTTTAPVLRISGPDGAAAAAVSLLGFEPDESLVVINVSGPNLRLGPIMRVDLMPADHQAGLVAQVAGTLSRVPAQNVIILIASADHAAYEAFAFDLCRAVHGAGIRVMDVLYMAGGRVGMYDCPEVDPVPYRGTETARAFAAGAALLGRAALPSRAALTRSIAHNLSGPQHDATALAAARNRLASVPDAALCHVASAVIHTAADGHRSPDWISLLAATTLSVQARDAALGAAVARHSPELIAALVTCATMTSDALAADVCTVLAVSAYRAGDGALANVALERVLTADPDHVFGRLLLGALGAAMPPQDLDALMAV